MSISVYILTCVANRRNSFKKGGFNNPIVNLLTKCTLNSVAKALNRVDLNKSPHNTRNRVDHQK